MSSPPSIELVEHAATMLLHAQHAVALTGAGISTPSGIPDFRSRESGLWTKYDPFTVASISAFRYHPLQVLEWVRPLVSQITSAEPNPAHTALARLEAAGRLDGVITQNIDGLHTKAGSKHVFEIHGHLRTATCTSCFRKAATDDLIEPFVKDGVIPRCGHCGGLLKPDIVLFGEQLPYETVQGAEDLLKNCDLVLIVGSSLEVTPAATMPVAALNRGASLIIVNHDPTYLDERADLVFHQDVVDVLPQIANEVLNG
ncbi:MAG: SIR2 family NAD-dependent protein deacylase [Anaerolineales bacterium]